MLTTSENAAFRGWLVRLSDRCQRLAGHDLDDCQSVLESAGVLPEPGLMHLLADRWRRGAAVGPSAGWLLLLVERETAAFSADGTDDTAECAGSVLLASAGCRAADGSEYLPSRQPVGNVRQVAAGAALAGHWREVAAVRQETAWASFLVAIDAGFRAAADLAAADRQWFADDSAALWSAAS